MSKHKLYIASKAEAIDANREFPNRFFYLSIGSENDGGWPDLYPDYKVCRLNFDDIVYPEKLAQSDIEANNIVLPSIPEIKKGLDFCRAHQHSEIIIHCYAGISRSSAMCYLVLFDRLKDVLAAKKALYEVKDRTLILPNEYIVRLGFKLLTDCGEKTYDLVRQYNSIP